MLKNQKNNETRLHYKMYKAGKFWVFSSIATLAVGTGLIVGPNLNVSANDTTVATANNNEPQTTSDSTTSQASPTIKNDDNNSKDSDKQPASDQNPSNNDKTNNLDQKAVSEISTDNSENNLSLDNANVKNNDSVNTNTQTNPQFETENTNVAQPSKLLNDQQVKAADSSQDNSKQTGNLNTPVINEDQKNNLPQDKVQVDSNMSAKDTIDNQTSDVAKQVPANPSPVVTNNDQASVIPSAPITTTTENKQNDNNNQTVKNTTNAQQETDATVVENNPNLPNDALKSTTPTNINIANTNVSADDQRNKNVTLAVEAQNNTDNLTGTWGTVNWSYDQNNNVLSLDTPGTLGTFTDTGNPITNESIAKNVKEIDINQNVKLPENSLNLFGSMPSLELIKGLNNVDGSNAVSLEGMFAHDNSLKQVDISGWDLPNVTSMTNLFNTDASLTDVNLSNVNAPKVITMDNLFLNSPNLTHVNMTGINTPSLTSMVAMFYTCHNLVSIEGIDDLDTGNVTNMDNIFNNATALTSLNLSNWDTSKVTSMVQMFFSASSLTSINIGGSFAKNTGNVTDMNYMFCGAQSLVNITGLDQLDTHNVTNMSFMFNGDSSLTSLDVSNFNTENVTNMQNMFNFICLVHNLDLKNFKTDKVTNMENMFSYDYGLNTLDLSSFDTRNVTNMQNMLQYVVVGTYDSNKNIVSIGVWQLILGPNTVLQNNVSLSDPRPGSIIPPTINLPASGQWQELGSGQLPQAPYTTFSNNYTPNGQLTNAADLTNGQTHPGIWVWAVKNNFANIYGKTADNWYANSEVANNWNPGDEINTLTNPDGFQLTDEQKQQAINNGTLAIQYQNADGQQATENDLRTTPGKYNVIYSWYGKTFTCIVTVKGTKTVTETSTGSVTVAYQYADGKTAAATVNKEVTFQRTNVVDDTTGAVISYGEWNPAATDVSISSPTIKGYTPNPKTISISLTAGQNEKVIVTYTANDETAKVQYIDNTTGKVIDGVADTTLTGKYGQAIDKTAVDTEVKNLEAQGYQSVGSNIPATFDFDGEIPTFTVNFEHKTEQVTDTSTGMLTVHYQYADGKSAADTVKKQVAFSRTGTKDLVTGNTDWNDWSPKSETVSVESPLIKGYTANKETVTGKLTAGAATNDTVTYTANDETAKVQYVDNTTGKVIDGVADTTLTGKYGQTIDKDAVDAEIKNLEAQGYQSVGSNIPATFDFDGEIPTFTVNFNHATKDVNDTSFGSLTIHYQYENGTKAQDDQVVKAKFTRTGTEDAVTHKINWNEWTSTDNTKVDFTVPVIKGYTPSQNQVTSNLLPNTNNSLTIIYTANNESLQVNYVDEQGNQLAASDTLTGKYGDNYQTSAKNITGYHVVKTEGNLAGKYTTETPDVTYVYAPNDETAKVQYVDNTTGKVIDGVADTILTGKYGQTIDKTAVDAEIKNLKGQGYQSVGSNIPATFDFDGETPTYSVHFNHVTEQVTNTNNGSLTVHYQYVDGKSATDDVTKQVAFSRTGTKDLVTGNIEWNAWSPEVTSISVDSPVITGFTPDKQNVTDQITAGENDDETVIYTANDETATINYTTSNGTVVASVSINGKYGAQISILSKIPSGYHYVNGPENYTFNANIDQNITVIVAKDENPVKTGQVVINYIDENGNKIADSIVESGNIDSQYNVVSPIVAGYKPNQVMISGKFEPGTKTIKVVYSKNSIPSEPTTPSNNGENSSQTTSAPATPTDNDGTSNSAKANNQPNEVTSETNVKTKQVTSSDHNVQTPSKSITSINAPETTTVNSTSAISEAASTTQKINKSNTLPQTGQSNENKILSIMGAILLSVFGIFGLGGLKKKETK